MTGHKRGPMKDLPQVLAPIEDRVGFIGEVAIFDESFERSLINIVPPAVKVAMLRVKHNEPNVFHFHEEKLKKWSKPTPDITMLKLNFWDEYNFAQMEGKDLSIARFLRGNCTRDYFYDVILPNDRWLAWIITPPKDIFNVHREMLFEGLEVERDVLRAPHKKKGQLDLKLIAVKLQIIQGLKLRVLGAVTQKLETKSLQLSVSAGKDSLAGSTLEELNQLEASLARIQTQLVETEGVKQIDATTETIDAEVAEESVEHGTEQASGGGEGEDSGEES